MSKWNYSLTEKLNFPHELFHHGELVFERIDTNGKIIVDFFVYLMDANITLIAVWKLGQSGALQVEYFYK